MTTSGGNPNHRASFKDGYRRPGGAAELVDSVDHEHILRPHPADAKHARLSAQRAVAGGMSIDDAVKAYGVEPHELMLK